MPSYPDNRGKFSGVYPWEVAPATPRSDNPVPAREAKTTMAHRQEDEMVQDEKGNWVLKLGSRNPRRDFRLTTAENLPETVESASSHQGEESPLVPKPGPLHTSHTGDSGETPQTSAAPTEGPGVAVSPPQLSGPVLPREP